MVVAKGGKTGRGPVFASFHTKTWTTHVLIDPRVPLRFYMTMDAM